MSKKDIYEAINKVQLQLEKTYTETGLVITNWIQDKDNIFSRDICQLILLYWNPMEYRLQEYSTFFVHFTIQYMNRRRKIKHILSMQLEDIMDIKMKFVHLNASIYITSMYTIRNGIKYHDILSNSYIYNYKKKIRKIQRKLQDAICLSPQYSDFSTDDSFGELFNEN